MLVWVEVYHARLGLVSSSVDFLPKDCAEWAQKTVGSALGLCSLEEAVRYNPLAWDNELPLTGDCYCVPCGAFARSEMTKAKCPTCAQPLSTQVDFEALCDSLVWTNVFRECSLTATAADGTCCEEDLLQLLRQVRPYKDIETLGKESYVQQAYMVTHLLFSLSGWGAAALSQPALFVEEFVFLAAGMQTAVSLDDPELVGEFCQSLRILGTGDGHPAVVRGVRFLLNKERGKNGNFVSDDDSLFKRYHAAYCGAIGLLDINDGPRRALPNGWEKFFK